MFFHKYWFDQFLQLHNAPETAFYWLRLLIIAGWVAEWIDCPLLMLGLRFESPRSVYKYLWLLSLRSLKKVSKEPKEPLDHWIEWRGEDNKKDGTCCIKWYTYMYFKSINSLLDEKIKLLKCFLSNARTITSKRLILSKNFTRSQIFILVAKQLVE